MYYVQKMTKMVDHIGWKRKGKSTISISRSIAGYTKRICWAKLTDTWVVNEKESLHNVRIKKEKIGTRYNSKAPAQY